MSSDSRMKHCVVGCCSGGGRTSHQLDGTMQSAGVLWFPQWGCHMSCRKKKKISDEEEEEEKLTLVAAEYDLIRADGLGAVICQD